MSKGLITSNQAAKSVMTHMQKAAAEATAALTQFNELTGSRLQDMADQYAQLQEDIERVTVELDERRRRETVALEIELMANKEEAYRSLASQLGMAIIKTDALAAIEAERSDAVNSKEQAVAAAVEQTKVNAAKSKAIAVDAVNAEHRAERAEDAAQINSLQSRLDASQSEVTRLQEMLKEAQASAVKVAEAVGKQTFNIPSGK